MCVNQQLPKLSIKKKQKQKNFKACSVTLCQKWEVYISHTKNIPLVTRYMLGRSISVKFYKSESSVYQLCGGFTNASRIGQDYCQGASNDAGDHVNIDDRFCYVDNLHILELIMLT